MIVADASWVIALRDPDDAHHQAAVNVNVELGRERVLLPSLTLAECLVGAAQLGMLDTAAAQLRAAFEVIEADTDAPLRWARLRSEAALRLPDAIVLDLALTEQARAIATFDITLAARARERDLEVLP